MNPTDVIIQIFSNHLPQNVRDEDFSYIGWDCNDPITAFGNYADSYRYAADLLYDEFQKPKESQSDLDRLGYAICYLYRHSIELSLTFIYMSTRQTFEDEIRFINNGHDIFKLWTVIKPLIEMYRDDEWDAIEHYISEFNEFDGDSKLMRYPVNKAMKPNKKDMQLNIKRFSEAAQKLQTKLMDIGHIVKDYNILSNI